MTASGGLGTAHKKQSNDCHAAASVNIHFHFSGYINAGS
jgi:hypothetical protein